MQLRAREGAPKQRVLRNGKTNIIAQQQSKYNKDKVGTLKLKRPRRKKKEKRGRTRKKKK
jgi:hypothetical protein